jgi:hypothetical protein
LTPIDYKMLGDILNNYRDVGYTYVETPWVVPREVSEMTYRGDVLSCQLGDLVGSAEQGFLALPEIKDTKLVSCGPCFRNEPVIDALHQSWFMKVELYQSGDHLEEMVHDAEQQIWKLVWTYLNRIDSRRVKEAMAGGPKWPAPDRIDPRDMVAHVFKRKVTPDGIDLMLNGIEIGSYGVRTVGKRTWTYGTGLALPRFTVALDTLDY